MWQVSRFDQKGNPPLGEPLSAFEMLLLATCAMLVLTALAFILYARLPLSALDLASSHSRYAGLADAQEPTSSSAGRRKLTTTASIPRTA